MLSAHFVLPLLAMTGCAPTNTTISEGSFIAYLAAETSASLATGNVDPTDEDWDYAFNIDCREFDSRAERQNFQLADPINVCEDDLWPPINESWASRGAYQVVGGELDTYRGDAMINSEGDIQFAFHHRLPNGEDFRFTFAVDPDFQPTACVGDGEGGVLREPLYGDWVEEWSQDFRRLANRENLPAGWEFLDGVLDGGRTYMLNSQAYQFNPEWWQTLQDDDDDQWFLPNQWLSGSAVGAFSEDLLQERPQRYGEPEWYELYETGALLNIQSLNQALFPNGDIWYCDEDTYATAEGGTREQCLERMGERLETVRDDTVEEFRLLSNPGPRADGETGPVFVYRPYVHLNDWQEADEAFPGMEAWGQMDYSFVVFSADSDLTVGGTARGGFQILFEALGSSSRVIVKGQFETTRIRRDRWGAQDLFADKAEENNVELCFEQ